MLRLPRFDYVSPASLEDAISLLARGRGKVKIIAGGTDILVKMKKRDLVGCQRLLSLKGIPGLDLIMVGEDVVKLGPMVTHEAVAQSRDLNKVMGFLCRACGDLGTYHIRFMGTVGGNICNGSPSADSTPSLLALGSQLKLLGPNGERTVPLEEFFMGPFKTSLRNDEVLVSIEIPKLPPASRGVYLKIPKVTENDETLAGVAMLLTPDSSKGVIEDIKIGLGSLAPTAIRAKRTEAYLKGQDLENPGLWVEAKRLLMSEISPRSRPDYRRRIAGYLFDQAFRMVIENPS